MQSEQSERAQAELTATLERALVRELVAEWRRINAAYFKGALTLPSIELSTNVTTDAGSTGGEPWRCRAP